MEKLSFKDKLALLNQNLGNKPIIKQIITMPDDETLHQRKTTVVLKNKVKEKDIDAIALSVEQSYHIGWSSGYHDCEMDIDESI